MSAGLAFATVVAVLAVPAAQQAPPPVPLEARLQEIQAEISQLERALRRLDGEERGILGELDRLDAELRLRESEVRESRAHVDEITAAIEEHDATLSRLDEAQEERRRYLSFRLRELYKAGSDPLLRRLLEGEDLGGYWEGLSYASYLSERDARVLSDFRGDAERSAAERSALERRREELAAVHAELERRRDAAAGARGRRAATLEGLRRDETRHRAALRELREAADDLGRLAATLAATEGSAVDIRPFKGLLDWPVQGELREGFGTVVHPQFGTTVPHPGWDIAADFGANVVAIFDGQVIYADWMRGYGLTVILDHGGGLLSIYAHASVLLVQAGDPVARGQLLGKVGETGSLRGPFLYFELRVDGKPTDPADWLRGH